MTAPTVQQLLLLWILVLTVVGFAAVGVDKLRAVTGKWRIRERTLFLLAILGGSLGIWLGMGLFRHKTKHNSFRFGVPAILIAQLLLALGVCYWSTFVR